MKKLSVAKVAAIKAQLAKNTHSRDIAKLVGVSKSSVNNIRNHLRDAAPTHAGGRPAKLSEKDKSTIKRAITSGRADNAQQALRELQSKDGPKVSVDTVRRALKQEGFKASVKVKKPMMTKKHRKARLKFALEHIEWTQDDWMRVIWSDETKINRIGSDGREWLWAPQGSGLTDRKVKPTLKFGGGNIMIWGCLTYAGPGTIALVKGRMDGAQYRDILCSNLLPALDAAALIPELACREQLVFQQDNDPKHTAKLTKQWFQDNKITVMDWPANSPDLNPIEHFWNALKRRLADYEVPPKGALDLWERAQTEWAKLSIEEGKPLIDSMHKRCQAVIKAKGGNTKY